MMGSQLGGIRAVPGELILRIVENMDTKTRENFMIIDKVYTDLHSTETLTTNFPMMPTIKAFLTWQ